MEFKKCSRCGNFFVADGDVCPNCVTRDRFEFNQFKDYVAQNGVDGNLDYLSNNTGISGKNINRYMGYSGLKFKK